MTRRPHSPLVRLAVVLPVCVVLLAGLMTAAWIALGPFQPAKGAIWFQVTRVGDAQYDASPSQPFFFLALGNDGRSDADKGLGDAIHVIGVNPAQHKATILNVPRDTKAPAGDKINSYHALGGLPGIVAQLNQMMGIQIRYAITTNFPGITAMVDEVGGIDINVPTAMHDSFSGAMFQPGPIHMTGDQFLRFSRDRHDFTNGDITRTGNQAIAIVSALSTLRAQNPGDAGTMHLVAILAKHVRLDSVNITDLWHLGRLALTIDPANIKQETVPVGNGAGTELVLGPGAVDLFHDFADDGILESH